MFSEPLQESQAVKVKYLSLLILFTAALLRLLFLGMKPPHFDEGINGWFADQIAHQGFYHYDPSNYHGPLHFYLLFVMQTLFGRHIEALRIVAVISSLGAVWMLLKCDRFFGRTVAAWAALAMALSPAMTFYGRYAIHEASLLFFMLLTFWGILGLWRFGTAQYLWAAALGLTGMVLTKETYIIHAVSFLLAFPALWLIERFIPSEPLPKAVQLWTKRDLKHVILVCVGLVLFFYSGALLDPASLKGLYQTFAAWVHTGTHGSGHEKPFYYWVKLIGRYEWSAGAGLILVPFTLWPGQSRLLRYTAIYGVGALTAYSMVAYKTPWCVIVLIWPFFILFGALITWLFCDSGLGGGSSCRSLMSRGASKLGGSRALPILRSIAIMLALVCSGSSLAQSVRLNFFRYTDSSEPYVYVQTFNDMHKITGPLLELASRDPAAYHLKGQFHMSSFYPLPWVLGDFTNIGYYSMDNPPTLPGEADFLLIEEKKVAEIEPQLRQPYFTDTITLRDSQDPARLYLCAKVFSDLFPGRTPELQP